MASKIPTPAEELANSHVNPTARKIWEETLAQPEFADVGVIWAYSASPSSDHRNGRCCDFMVTHTKTSLTRSQQVQLGNRMRAYFTKHARRLHVQGIIWNHQVTGYPVNHPHISNPDVDYRGPSGVARQYGGSDQHTDHNHVQVTGEAFKPLVPEKPLAWDGKSFPGTAAFHIGANGPWVTLLGQRLVAHGWTGYVEGPGPVFTDSDQAGVAWFQKRQGWTGDDADGIPGAQTWALLMTDPTPPIPVPVPTPEPALTTIRVATLNILHDDPATPIAPRLERIVTAIKASRASVLLLQESDAADAAKVQDKLGADWIWSRAGSNAVMVDKTVWTMGEERTYTLPTPYSHTKKDCPLVQLTHKNGDVIWATSIHPSATSPYTKKGIATEAQMNTERYRQGQFIVKTLDAYHWLVGGGDHNSSSLASKKVKDVLRDAGFKLLTLSKTFDSSNVDSFPNHTPGGQQIDDIWIKDKLTFTDGDIISTHGGSDHNLMVAELTIAER